MAQVDPLRIDVIRDVIYARCVIGFMQLRAACNATGTGAVAISHRFDSDREMAPGS